MREGNSSRRQGVGIDNHGWVEHGYGTERNGGAAGGRAQQWHIERRRCCDGSERGIVDTRQSSCGWVGSGAGAKGQGNREVEAEGGQLSHCHPSSVLASMVLAQP